jgi:GNAT superfamily N-acetyltransferase
MHSEILNSKQWIKECPDWNSWYKFRESNFKNQKQIILKSDYNNEIIGFISISVNAINDYGIISFIEIKESERNKGYGSILINKVKEYFEDYKIKRIEIWSNTSFKLMKFLLKNGFKPKISNINNNNLNEKEWLEWLKENGNIPFCEYEYF